MHTSKSEQSNLISIPIHSNELNNQFTYLLNAFIDHINI